MGYEKLSLIGLINEIKSASTGPHPRKFCFVLGAGTSRTSGIKSGQELVNIWERELNERNEEAHTEWKKKLGITEENRAQFYSQYYERRFSRHPEDGYNYLEKMMEAAKPSVGYVMLAHILSNKIHNVVITTNFDHLVEDAITYYENKIPLVIGHESLVHYITRQKQIMRPTIIKIHRDLLYDPKSKATELQILHNNWSEALHRIFEEYHPIFIGYAGNDKSLMDFLIENKQKFQEGTWLCPYWMFYKSEPINEKVEKFLNCTQGYSIRHEGFDNVLYRLGAALDYRIPEEKAFMEEAEKRYLDISNAIDSFSDIKNITATRQNLLSKECVKSAEDNENLTRDSEESIQFDKSLQEAIRQITNQSDLQRKYWEVLSLYEEKKYEEAEKICRELVIEAPQNARYHHCLGDILFERGILDDARKEMQTAIDLEPENSWHYVGIGRILNETEELLEASKQIKKAIELEPDEPNNYSFLGWILQKMENLDEAFIWIKKAVELAPDDSWYRCCLGEIYMDMEDFENAYIEVKKAIDLEPDDSWYHNVLGCILLKMGKAEEAQRELSKAVELEPDCALYHSYLGEAWEALGNLKKAHREFQRAEEIRKRSE